ncbi:MAG: Mpv17/PMP22 family protein [Bacteroidales bacterium]|nr:Mpv17/PMP22 family protein [Bacteroidales bacterium]
MKKSDLYFILFFVALFAPFFIFDIAYQWYNDLNKSHGMIMSFFKFAVLATMGESIGLRIKNGVYNYNGFGLLSRAMVWGFLGLTIKLAFVVFAKGTPQFLLYLGFEEAPKVMGEALSFMKVLVAFSISLFMNVIYAPVMMTLHKITDTHIVEHGGKLVGLLKPIRFSKILKELNWDVQWNFVFKKTIPFFWIPAHTITFLLPPDFQVLFAALLGIVLGVILSIASLKK